MFYVFLLSQTSDDKLNYLALGLNFKPFRFTDNKEYFLTDKADPDDNLYKHLSMNSLFYTEEQFKHKFAVSTELLTSL